MKLINHNSTSYEAFYSIYSKFSSFCSLLDYNPIVQEKLSSVCKELGIDENALIKQRAWCVGSALSALQLSKAGYSADAGIDKYLWIQLKPKKRLELEGADLQYDLLNSFSDAEQEKYFISGLSSISWSCSLHWI